MAYHGIMAPNKSGGCELTSSKYMGARKKCQKKQTKAKLCQLATCSPSASVELSEMAMERERESESYIYIFILFSLSLCLFFPFLSIVRSLQDQSGRWQRGDKAQQIVNDNEAERLFEMRQEEKRNMKDLKNLGEILEILCEICEYL